jgi:hypothetical protein
MKHPSPSQQITSVNLNKPNSLSGAALFFAFALLCPVNAIAQSDSRADEWRYTVAPGDTLIALINRLMKPSTEWQKLQKLNRISNAQRLVPGSVLRIPVEWLRSDATVATVQLSQGAISVRRATARLATTAAGTQLMPGDKIETGAQSTLTMRFIDGSQMVVSPNSKVTIENLLVFGQTGITETRLKIEEGGVDSQVKPMTSSASRYTVSTPVFNLGVRGTDFRARFDPKSQVAFSEVLEGGVVAAGKTSEVRVGAGFGTLALVNTEPQAPKKLLGEPLLRGVTKLADSVPLILAWEPEAGAKAYRAKIFTNQALERQLLEGVFDQAGARWPDLPDGAYVLQVRSIDADGLEGSTSVREFIRKARPEAPFVNQPANTAKVYGDSVIFKWSESKAAESYRLQVSDSPDFKAPKHDSTIANNSEKTVTLAPGNYFWRIASIAKGNDQGPFSESYGFVQRKIPESPGTLEASLDNENNMAFRWKSREPGLSYQYQLSPDDQFAVLLLDKTTTEPAAVFPKPPPGTYFLRLKTFDADGFAGPFGTAQKITIDEPPTPWLKVLPAFLLLGL